MRKSSISLSSAIPRQRSPSYHNSCLALFIVIFLFPLIMAIFLLIPSAAEIATEGYAYDARWVAQFFSHMSLIGLTIQIFCQSKNPLITQSFRTPTQSKITVIGSTTFWFSLAMHLLLYLFSRLCFPTTPLAPGHIGIGECVSILFQKASWQMIFVRVTTILMIIHILLLIFRQKSAHRGCLPYYFWKPFHGISYLCFPLVSVHSISFGFKNMTTSMHLFPAVHLINPIYLCVLGCGTICFPLYRLYRRFRQRHKHWIVTNGQWVSDGMYSIELRHESILDLEDRSRPTNSLNPVELSPSTIANQLPKEFHTKKRAPGQFVTIQFKRKDATGHEKKMWSSPNYAHIASAPSSDTLQLLIKEDEGKFTSNLEHIALPPRIVHLSPPFGYFGPNLERPGVSLLVCSPVSFGACLSFLRHAYELYCDNARLRHRLRILFVLNSPRQNPAPMEIKKMVDTMCENRGLVPGYSRFEMDNARFGMSASEMDVMGSDEEDVSAEAISEEAVRLEAEKMKEEALRHLREMEQQEDEEEEQAKHHSAAFSDPEFDALFEEAGLSRNKPAPISVGFNGGDYEGAHVEDDQPNAEASELSRNEVSTDGDEAVAVGMGQAGRRGEGVAENPLDANSRQQGTTYAHERHYTIEAQEFLNQTVQKRKANKAAIAAARLKEKRKGCVQPNEVGSCIRVGYTLIERGGKEEMLTNETMLGWIPYGGIPLIFQGSPNRRVLGHFIDNPSDIRVFVMGDHRILGKVPSELRSPPLNISRRHIRTHYFH